MNATIKMNEAEIREALAHWCGTSADQVSIDCDGGQATAEVDTTLDAMNAAAKKRRPRKPKAEGEG